MGPLGTNFNEILFETQKFSYKNALGKVICEMAAILFLPQWVKHIQLAQNDKQPADTISTCKFLNDNFKNWVNILLKYIPGVQEL